MADPKNQRIFITGASGYVGGRIATFAIAEGYTVHGLSRTESSDAKLKAMGAVPVRGDLTSLDVLRRESAAADVVMHLADPFTRDLSHGYEPVIRQQAAVADAFADSMQGTGKALVMTSGTLMAAADPNGGETDETAPRPEKTLVPRHLVEEYDLSLAKKGIRVSSIRLAPYVYGRGGSGVKLFMQMSAKSGGVICVDEGKSHTTTVHVDDAARLYLLAAQKAPAGSIYNATAETNVTARQLAEAISEAVHVPINFLTFAEAEAKLGVFFARFLAADNRASSAKAQKELGWEIREKVGILADIRSGSYQAVAKEILSQAGSAAPAN
ncbi:putative NAD dependent epimerase/dehydratase [Jackrogersella minutella]|nr:putative NAD dependent epimerase/dehydratase [Jackrogersella minutella]